MPDLISKCKNTHEKVQLWKKIVSGNWSEVLFIKYSMSAGYPWILFIYLLFTNNMVLWTQKLLKALGLRPLKKLSHG